MEEIQVGEYVRTKKGIMAKVDAIYEYGKRKKYKRYFTKKNEEFNEGTLIKEHLIYDTRQKYIPKHSKDIIDLIEVGDYVNGYKVVSIDKNAPENCIECIELNRNNAYEYQFISKKDIETILTKEMFENNCYRIGE